MMERWRAHKAVAAVIFATIWLAACDFHSTPLWGPNSPRNGANQVIDPVLGVPIAGYPNDSSPQ
jgi:hypothetical protein